MLNGNVDKIILVISERISLHYIKIARGSLIKGIEMRVEADGKTLSNTGRNFIPSYQPIATLKKTLTSCWGHSASMLVLTDQSQGACEVVCCRYEQQSVLPARLVPLTVASRTTLFVWPRSFSALPYRAPHSRPKIHIRNLYPLYLSKLYLSIVAFKYFPSIKDRNMRLSRSDIVIFLSSLL